MEPPLNSPDSWGVMDYCPNTACLKLHSIHVSEERLVAQTQRAWSFTRYMYLKRDWLPKHSVLEALLDTRIWRETGCPNTACLKLHSIHVSEERLVAQTQRAWSFTRYTYLKRDWLPKHSVLEASLDTRIWRETGCPNTACLKRYSIHVSQKRLVAQTQRAWSFTRYTYLKRNWLPKHSVLEASLDTRIWRETGCPNTACLKLYSIHVSEERLVANRNE